MSDHSNLKPLFFAEAFRIAISKSDYLFKNKLRYIVNQFVSSYNKDITPVMVKAYSVNDETFDKVSDVLEEIGEEFNKMDITDYYLFLQVIKEFNQTKQQSKE
jgi:hypothetical protein